MKVQAYISYGGRCEEALEFYKNTIGAEVTGLMRWKDSPDAAMVSVSNRFDGPMITIDDAE